MIHTATLPQSHAYLRYTPLASLITDTGTVPDVANGVNDPHPNLSFSLVHHLQSGDSGFEAVLNAASATALLNAVIHPGLDSACQRVFTQFSETASDGPGIISETPTAAAPSTSWTP